MSQRNTTSSGRGTTTLLAAVLVIVIATAGVAFLLLSSNDSDDDGAEETRSTFAMVDARSVDGSLADLPEAERERVDPVLGPADAQVTIFEYGAYGCLTCRRYHRDGIVEELLNEFDGQVNFVYRDFPVTQPAYSIRAAQVAQCALDQGVDAFWTLHDGFFTDVEIGTETDELIAYAGSIGLDEAELRACVDAGTHVETVNFDQTRAETLGLRGTPSFVVNDLRVYETSEETLRAAVEQALGS